MARPESGRGRLRLHVAHENPAAILEPSRDGEAGMNVHVPVEVAGRSGRGGVDDQVVGRIAERPTEAGKGAPERASVGGRLGATP